MKKQRTFDPAKEIAMLRNENSWLLETMKLIARTLELPFDLTMKALPKHAKAIMEELKAFRKSPPKNFLTWKRSARVRQ